MGFILMIQLIDRLIEWSIIDEAINRDDLLNDINLLTRQCQNVLNTRVTAITTKNINPFLLSRIWTPVPSQIPKTTYHPYFCTIFQYIPLSLAPLPF